MDTWAHRNDKIECCKLVRLFNSVKRRIANATVYAHIVGPNWSDNVQFSLADIPAQSMHVSYHRSFGADFYSMKDH